jgi:hypothetical protein
MPSATISFQGSIAGISFAGDGTRTAAGQMSHEVSLAAGFAGTLASMDSAGTAGDVTGLESGHAITGSDEVAIWKDDAEADGTQVARYNVPVDSAAADSITFSDDSGVGGDALSDGDGTEVIVAEQAAAVDADFAGDDALAIVLSCTRRALVQFQTAAGGEIASFVLQANEPYVWLKDAGEANPLTGQTVGKIAAACGDDAAGTLKVGVLYDSAE